MPLFPALTAALAAATPVLAQEGSHASTFAATRDPISQSIVAVIIVAVFVFLALEKAHRVLVIFCAVALLWGITYLTRWHLITFEDSQRALDLNVLLLLAAMMAMVAVLKSTGVFAWAVSRLLDRSGGSPRLIQGLLIWFTAFLSGLADNVTTVIFATPMALALATELAIPPAALLMPMIMAANIGGTATLIGDPPNILIGSAADLSFAQFLLTLAMPVGFMMLALEAISWRWFRGSLGVGRPPGGVHVAARIEDPLLLRWALGISGLVFLGFLTHSVTGMPAAVPATIGAALLLLVQDVLYLQRHRPSHSERVHGMLEVLEKEIEWPTLSFFAFLFIAVGAAVSTGLIDTIAGGLSWVIQEGTSLFHLSPQGTLVLAAFAILWVSGIISGIIDNIPFVAVSIPIVATLAGQLPGDSVVLWWALSLGACLGGNGSPVGASANVTVIGLAERGKHRITFRDFLRFGVPITLLTLLFSSGFLVAQVYAGPAATLRVGLVGLALLVFARFVIRRRGKESHSS